MATLVDQHGNRIDPSQLVYYVLKRPDGAIVATWDEGRSWTPYESARLTQQYVRDYRERSR